MFGTKKLVLIVKTFLLWSGQISGTWDSYSFSNILEKKDKTGELLFQGNYVLLVFNDIDKTAVLFVCLCFSYKKNTPKNTPKKIKISRTLLYLLHLCNRCENLTGQ